MTIIQTQVSLQAQSMELGEQIITMTRLPVPWYAPKFLVKNKMKDSIPEYSQIPGLLRKYYSIEAKTGKFGGIYLWENQKAARDWFNLEWFSRVNKKYGGDNQVPLLKALYILNFEEKDQTTLTDRFANVKIFKIQVRSQKELISRIASKADSLKGIPGFISLWIAEGENSHLHVISLWLNPESFLAYNFDSLCSPEWKLVEEIETAVPYTLKIK